jgi:hypothetical protein
LPEPINVARGVVRTSLSSALAARGTLQLKTTVTRTKAVVLGRTSFSIGAGKTRVAVVRLTRSGLALLRKRGGRLSVLAIATARSGTGGTKITSVSATLKLVKSHR